MVDGFDVKYYWTHVEARTRICNYVIMAALVTALITACIVTTHIENPWCGVSRYCMDFEVTSPIDIAIDNAIASIE